MNNKTRGKRYIGRCRMVKNTRRRGGGKFLSYSTYFPKRLRKFTTAQIAQHAIMENSGLALGKIARPINNYLKNIYNSNRDKLIPDVSQMNERFKPTYARMPKLDDKIIIPMNLTPSKTKTQKVFDLASAHRQIGDILYRRVKQPVSHKSHSSRNSTSSSHSVSVRNSQNSRDSRYNQNARNRGP